MKSLFSFPQKPVNNTLTFLNYESRPIEGAGEAFVLRQILSLPQPGLDLQTGVTAQDICFLELGELTVDFCPLS